MILKLRNHTVAPGRAGGQWPDFVLKSMAAAEPPSWNRLKETGRLGRRPGRAPHWHVSSMNMGTPAVLFTGTHVASGQSRQLMSVSDV